MKLLMALISVMILSACTGVELENSKRLMARPDFQQAKESAPEWCRHALKTINYLESEIEAQ